MIREAQKRTSLISIIVPAFNQEKTIVHDLKKIHQVLEKLRYSSELICVVDGMLDRTFEKATKFAKESPRIKVVGYEKNKGKGYAIRYGIAESKGDIVGFIDAGMDLNPNGLSMLLEHFEWYNADIIVGSKRHPVSKVIYPWQRRVLSLGYQILVRLLFGLRVRDTQVGMKFFRRGVLKKVLPRLLVKEYAFDVEMLAVSKYLGFNRIFEAPVDIKLRFGGASTITSQKFLRTVLAMFWDTLAVFYRLKILRYYSDKNKRRWKFDPELNFRINIG
ncbi:MAG: glycosyltransferase [Candidatus Daviesbacteria bacterium]|nr:glycosyltransferase [Candidatus Daviesbacteria bacterium]